MTEPSPLATAPLGVSFRVVGGLGDSTWVLLHGSDGRETDLLPLVERVDPRSPRIAVRGAVLTALGYAFFDREPDGSFDDAAVAARVAPLAEAVELGRRALGRTARTTILGFSNGAVTAAALLEHRPDLFTGGVLLRPRLPFRSGPPPVGVTLPVLVVDGRHDARRTPEDGARTVERLRRAGVTVEHVTLEVGHGTTEDDERLIRDWLDRHAS